MSVDRRTRSDDAVPPVDPVRFFERELPEALERQRELVLPGAAGLALRPLGFEVGDEVWSLSAGADRIEVRSGPDRAGARVRLAPEELADLANDLATPMTWFTAGRLDMPAGGLPDLLDWWLVLRGALDARPIHVPGAIGFRDRDGGPLDLRRSFRPDDPLEDQRHFLHEAGFLHLEGVFEPDRMAEISADMDRAAPSYSEGDGQSWWAGVADGSRRLVRMQGFDRHSRATRELLESERFLALGAIPGDGHTHRGLEGNRIEALVKPIGVVQGISDVPWHKDCSLGRHSYECCSLTTGISVTGAGPASGQLRVIAGSHRALVWPALEARPHGLPELELPTRTGDVTLHLSCTLHMAQPPVERERRVMYTGFRLPLRGASDAYAAGRARLRAVREAAPATVSQEPASRS